MAFKFICDVDQCLNCGACMDLCPPQCLDMTRPQSGAEGDLDSRGSMPWMMAFPVQTSNALDAGCATSSARSTRSPLPTLTSRSSSTRRKGLSSPPLLSMTATGCRCQPSHMRR